MTNPHNSPDSLTVIRGRGRVSALGEQPVPPAVAVSPFSPHATGPAVGALPAALETQLTDLRKSHSAFRQLDRTVLLALLAARQATAAAGWLGPVDSCQLLVVGSQESAQRPAADAAGADAAASKPELPTALSNGRGAAAANSAPPTAPSSTSNQQLPTVLAVSMGSSRGATGRLEEFHTEFLNEGRVSAAASPLTTLGNVASWVAFDAGQANGAALSHSSTCSSAFQALGNAMAWLRAGMADRFLAGGTEAPLTAFTLAQMRAIGIYSPLAPAAWPCRPGAGRPATFVLGEGAAVFALEQVPGASLRPTDLVLAGVGFGFEAIGSKTGLSPEGQHFQRAMRAALAQAGVAPAAVDAVVLHSPGTPAGDAAERAALHAVFGEKLPALLSNKWLVGHTLGASAALSLDFACSVLETQQWPAPPFASRLTAAPTTQPIRRVLVNAAGFGGNAASVLVSRAG